jgi:hypothetical protein
MNLSIETKLAAALGVTFVAFVLGAIAQTQNDSAIAGPNQYAVTDNPASINPSRKEFQSSSSRTTQEDAKNVLANDAGRVSASANGKTRTKSTKHGSEAARVDHSYDD